MISCWHIFIKRTSQFSSIVLILLILCSNLAEARVGGNIANHYFLEKQKFLNEILLHIEEHLPSREWLGMGKNLILNQTNYVDVNDQMRQFQLSVDNGKLLARHEIFDIYDSNQYQQTFGLFYFFFNTNDWETLLLNACWARRTINPGMFNFALSQALMKRYDLKGLILPQIYEIMPQLFVKEQSVYIALKFDYGQYRRGEFLYQHYRHTQRLNGKIYLKSSNEQRSQVTTRKFNSTTQNSPKALADLTKLILPDLKKIRTIPDTAATISLDYLIQDIDWNAFWYYQNMGLWWNEVNNDLENFIEMWFGMLQQILARYKLEFYSNENGAVFENQVSFEDSSKLLYINGMKFHENTKQTLHEDEALKELTAKIKQCISEQSFEYINGTILDLTHGRNWSILLKELFGKNLTEFFKRFYKNSPQKSPNIQMYFETQLRDPYFYQKADILLKNYQNLRSNLQKYKLSDLKQPRIAFASVTISKLETFFEHFHFDASNLLPSKHFYYDGHLLWHKTLQARQRRLQLKVFTINFSVKAAASEAIIIRSFLAPPQGLRLNPPEAFFQLDSFVVNLSVGENLIQRKSTEFSFAPTRVKLDMSSLYRLSLLGLNDEYEFPLNITIAKCGFPQHLLLPRGDLHGDGLPVEFFFIATSYFYRFHDAPSLDCDFSEGVRRYDELPLGFPFDYDHEELESWKGENIYWKREKIYHLED